MSSLVEHLPAVPTWACVVCDQAWPCESAREALLAEYAACPAALGLYLGSAFVEASRDLEGAPAGELYRRFFGWMRAHGPKETPDPAS